MFRLLIGGGNSPAATLQVDRWTALCARRIYRNGRKRGASPLIARFAVGQFLADQICGNVPWQPWA